MRFLFGFEQGPFGGCTFVPCACIWHYMVVYISHTYIPLKMQDLWQTSNSSQKIKVKWMDRAIMSIFLNWINVELSQSFRSFNITWTFMHTPRASEMHLGFGQSAPTGALLLWKCANEAQKCANVPKCTKNVQICSKMT